MKRKVIQMAGKTMVVSLPVDWVRKFGIHKGDEIDLKEEGKRIIISTTEGTSKEILEVNITGLNQLIPRAIHALYKRGFDEIKLKFDDPSYKKIIRQALKNEVASLEIVEESENFCILKNVSTMLESEFDPILRRTFRLLILMSEKGLNALKNKKFDELEEAKDLELVNNRLTTFCRRVLNKNGYKDYKKLTFIYNLIENLEKIADRYKYLFSYVIKESKKIKLNKEIIKYYEETHNILNEFYNLYYKFDNGKASAIYDKRKELIEKGYKLMEKENKKEAVIIHHLIIVIQTTFNQLGHLIALSF